MTSFDQREHISTCMRLPIDFDKERALDEVRSIPVEMFSQISRGPTHKDVRSVFIKGYPPRLRKPDEDRDILKSLPYIASFIQNSLPGKPCKCVIAELVPNGIIPVHIDAPIRRNRQSARGRAKPKYFEDTVRIHVPVITSKFTSFFNNGEFFHLSEGEVWAVNNLAIHGVINEHPEDSRIHIIVDILPDEKIGPVIENADRVSGSFDPALLGRLMENSMAPRGSIYARGKPVPNQSMVERAIIR